MDSKKKVKETFPCEIRLLSASRDSRTPITAFSGGPLQLPDPQGKAGGACTSALLQGLYRENERKVSWSSVLGSMKQVLDGKGLDQVPQLMSSRLMEVDKPMDIVPMKHRGSKRALLIGINYSGKKGQLSDCHADAEHMKEFLTDSQGFAEADITILMDKQGHPYYPTRKNILACLRRLVTQSKAGDVAFVHFSGHSGREIVEKNKAGHRYKETLIPVDVAKAGPIQADELYNVLFCAMPAGVTLTCVMDCCHGGSVIALPYQFTADNDSTEMYYDDSFDFAAALIGLAIIGGAVGVGVGVSGGGGDTTSAVNAISADTGNATSNAEAPTEGCNEGCDSCCEAFFDTLFGG